MLTLCLDTAYKYLTCALIEDNDLIASSSFECFKRQSEEVFSCLDIVFKQANKNKKDINAICVSIGPGSYTGVRIGLTIAKVICQCFTIDLYTISTLRLYANNQEDTMVCFNARANRAYVGIYDKEKTIEQDCVKFIDDIDINGHNLVGDLSLFGKEDFYPNIPECFLNTKDHWQKAENIAFTNPIYLKESESYLK